jgi:HEXXH motif-containing protein
MTALEFAPAGQADDAALQRIATADDRYLHSVLGSLGAQMSPGTPAARAVADAAFLLDTLGPADRRDVLLHPMYRIWRTQLTKRVSTGERQPVEDWIGHLPRLLVGTALKSGAQLAPLRVPVTDGELRLPGLPRHLQLGSGGAHAVLRRDGEHLVAEYAGRDYRYPLRSLLHGGAGVAEHAVLPDTAIELDASDPWIRDSLREHTAASSSPAYPARDVAPAPALGAHREVFDGGARLIARAWPECVAELESHVRLVVPFTSKLMAGWTALTQLGAIYVRAVGDGALAVADDPAAIDPIAYTAERLVHEGAHTRLYCLSFGRSLFTGDGDGLQLLKSPLRKDLRPAAGVFHAAFVLGRVVVFAQRAARLTGSSRLAERAEHCHRDLNSAADALTSAGVLTALGRNLLDQAKSAADQAAGVTTPASASAA